MTFNENEIQIEILPDGRVKIITDDVSGPNHRAADELMKFLGTLLGGDVVVEKRPHAHAHQHAHTGASHKH